MKIMFLSVTLGASLSVLAATWTGAGDGTSWSDPANWGGSLPGESEVVTIPGSGARSISLGASDVSVGGLFIEGSGKLTMSGSGSLSLSNIASKSDVDFDVPVTFKEGNNYVSNCVVNIEFLKPVTVEGETKTFTFCSDSKNTAKKFTNLRSTFFAPDTDILMKMGLGGSTTNMSVHFYGKVTASLLSCCREGLKSSYAYLHASSNQIENVEICYGGIVLDAENALPETTALKWNLYISALYKELGASPYYSYNFTGKDQVLEAIRHDKQSPVSTPTQTNSLMAVGSLDGTSTTLTLRACSNAVANCVIGDGISLVFDPLSPDCVQKLQSQTSTTKGSIEVKGGTFQLDFQAKIPDLSLLTIRSGAKVNVYMSRENALENLGNLVIEDGGIFNFDGGIATFGTGDTTYDDPFSGGLTIGNIAQGGQVRVKVNLGVTFNQLQYNGKTVRPGTYVKTGNNTIAGATQVEWVQGQGKVIVLSEPPPRGTIIIIK